MEIDYCSLGAVPGIGASAHYLRFDRWGVLLDAGMDPHQTGEAVLPRFDLLDSAPLQAILISHAHLDHLGGLPAALQAFPHSRVYMSEATVELASEMLHHFLSVQQKYHSQAEPGYDHEFLEQIYYLYQGFAYRREFPLHGYEESGLRFSFWDAGHILGSAGILIEKTGKRVFYTGNVRLSSQFILQGAKLPDGPLDLLISEATYGDDEKAESLSRKQEVNRFSNRLTECLQNRGIVLLPVFALGRTQEMIALIHRLRMKNKIPMAPIYVAGMGIKINRVYDRLLHKIYPGFQHYTMRGMTFGRWQQQKKLTCPAILLSTSGMMFPGSNSFDFARSLAGEPRNAIFFVGYADPETPAGLFREEKHQALQELLGVDHINCQVDRFQFSAHAHRGELLNMIERLRPRKLIFSHGDAAALEWMARETRQRFPRCQVIIPEPYRRYRFNL